MTATATAEPVTQPVTKGTITIARTALRAALGKLLTVVATSRMTTDLASHIHVEAKDGRLTLTGTNYDAFLRLTLSCELEGEASTLLPAKLLADIVGALPPVGAVTITLAETGATITAGRSRFELAAMSALDFPEIPAVQNSGAATVHAARFLDALSRALPHASDAESRPALNVVLLERFGERGLIAVTHDGAALARVDAGEIADGDGAAFPARCSVDRHGVPLLERLFAGLADEATLTISADHTRLRIEAGELLAQVRLVEYEFPKYAGAVDAEKRTHVFSCERAELAAALKRVGIASDDTRAIDLTIDAAIEIRAAKETSRASDSVELDVHERPDGASLTIRVNATKIGDALDTLTGDRVEISSDGPTRALFLRDAARELSDPTVVLLQPLTIR
jgi:DNA polymerase-3 subunit beta